MPWCQPTLHSRCNIHCSFACKYMSQNLGPKAPLMSFSKDYAPGHIECIAYILPHHAPIDDEF